MTAVPVIPTNLDEHALNQAVSAVRKQSAWCPKVGEIPHYELQTLLSIGIRAYWQSQGTLARQPMLDIPKKPKGPSRTPSTRQRVLQRDKNVCYLCEKKIDLRDASVDHVIPKSKGGTNSMGNLRAAHKDCNFLKGDMSLDDYRKLYPVLKAVEP
jgi:5-methylcytosine-specific restriction endonuclease McrA